MSNATPACPRLVVGLGNPGIEYASTRHNAGFWFIDLLARELRAPMLAQAKFFGEAGRTSTDVWLLKPATFMNRSGQSVAALARFYKIQPEEVLVVHDELDLPPGELRLKQGGGAGGHNGIKDIQAQLGNANFWRLRVGIGHPRTLGLQQDVADFVLHRPRSDEQVLIERALERSLLAWPRLAAGAYGAAQQMLHAKPSK